MLLRSCSRSILVVNNQWSCRSMNPFNDFSVCPYRQKFPNLVGCPVKHFHCLCVMTFPVSLTNKSLYPNLKPDPLYILCCAALNQWWGESWLQIRTPHCSTLGGTRSCVALQALASCCACCWGDGCAAPAVSAAWPGWRRQRNVQTLGQSQLHMERINTTLSFWHPQLFSFVYGADSI